MRTVKGRGGPFSSTWRSALVQLKAMHPLPGRTSGGREGLKLRGGWWKAQCSTRKAAVSRRGEERRKGEERGQVCNANGIHLFCYARTKTYSSERVRTVKGRGGPFSIHVAIGTSSAEGNAPQLTKPKAPFRKNSEQARPRVSGAGREDSPGTGLHPQVRRIQHHSPSGVPGAPIRGRATPSA